VIEELTVLLPVFQKHDRVINVLAQIVVLEFGEHVQLSPEP